jgi:hypothetical protein
LDHVALWPQLLPTETAEINLEMIAGAHRLVFEQKGGRQCLLTPVPPRPPSTLKKSFRSNHGEEIHELQLRQQPTRWWMSSSPPPWPVERWWRSAYGAGLDALPFNCDSMPYPRYDDFVTA